jgi:hypothetical protein
MHIKQLKEKQKQIQKQVSNFYTPSGLHVYFKDRVTNGVNVEKVISKAEEMLPQHLRTEVEMVIVGQIEDFIKKDFNAMYEGGTIYVTNIQDNESDMVDDIIHEFAHSVEEPYGYFIYGDSKIKNEFLEKRMILHDILWKAGYKAPKSFFSNIDYDSELDEFLYKKVGYEKLSRLCVGVFISAYAPTSLKEYFATGYTEFFMYPNEQTYLKRVSPQLYKKIFQLYSEENLDV